MFSVIFPGQGSQVVGMGKEFFDKHEIVKKLFKEADEILEFSLRAVLVRESKICWGHAAIPFFGKTMLPLDMFLKTKSNILESVLSSVSKNIPPNNGVKNRSINDWLNPFDCK